MRETQGVGRPHMPAHRRLTMKALVLIGTVSALTIIGPFGTFADLTFAARLAYWGGLILSGWLLFEGLSRGFVALAVRRGMGWRWALGGVYVVVTLLMTVLVAFLERSVRENDFFNAAGFAELFGYVAVLTAVAAILPLRMELRERRLIGEGDTASDLSLGTRDGLVGDRQDASIFIST